MLCKMKMKMIEQELFASLSFIFRTNANDNDAVILGNIYYLMTHQKQPTNAPTCVEILRVTLISLEGIELSDKTLFRSAGGTKEEKLAEATAASTVVLPDLGNWRITVWAGFHSSFPTGCLSVPTSHYSTIFESEGNLLAVESDQMELNSSPSSFDRSSSIITGSVHWQCCTQADDLGGLAPMTPNHHLQVVLPPPQHTLSTTTASEELTLPDIIEIHVCIVCISINTQLSDSPMDRNSTAEDLASSNSFRYKDERDTSSSFTQEEHYFCHGVAHLKVPSCCQSNATKDLDLSGFSRPGGKVAMLPVRTKPPIRRSNNVVDTDNNVIATFVNNAILSVQVEKLIVPKEQVSKCNDVQRHYIKSDWKGESCAPASVSPHNSQERNNHFERAGQVISSIRQTLSSQISNLIKSEEEMCPSNDLAQFSHLLKITCGDLGDVLHGGEDFAETSNNVHNWAWYLTLL